MRSLLVVAGRRWSSLVSNDFKKGLLNALTGSSNVSTSLLNSFLKKLMNQIARKPVGRKIRPKLTSFGKRVSPTRFLTKYSLRKPVIKKELVKKKIQKRRNL